MRILSRVGGFGQRGERWVPRTHEGVTTLFNPAVEIGGGDFVRVIQERVRSVKELDGGGLVDDAFGKAAE